MGSMTPGELPQPSSATSMALASSGGSGMPRLKSVVPAAARQLLMFLASGTRGTFSVAASGLMPFWCLGRGQGVFTCLSLCSHGLELIATLGEM